MSAGLAPERLPPPYCYSSEAPRYPLLTFRLRLEEGHVWVAECPLDALAWAVVISVVEDRTFFYRDAPHEDAHRVQVIDALLRHRSTPLWPHVKTEIEEATSLRATVALPRFEEGVDDEVSPVLTDFGTSKRK